MGVRFSRDETRDCLGGAFHLEEEFLEDKSFFFSFLSILEN